MPHSASLRHRVRTAAKPRGNSAMRRASPTLAGNAVPCETARRGPRSPTAAPRKIARPYVRAGVWRQLSRRLPGRHFKWKQLSLGVRRRHVLRTVPARRELRVSFWLRINGVHHGQWQRQSKTVHADQSAQQLLAAGNAVALHSRDCSSAAMRNCIAGALPPHHCTQPQQAQSQQHDRTGFGSSDNHRIHVAAHTWVQIERLHTDSLVAAIALHELVRDEAAAMAA